MGMNKKEVERLSEIYLERATKLFGLSKYHSHTPYLYIDYSPNSTGVDNEWKGEFESEENEIIIYRKNITNKEDLARTIIHEYCHYLQSPAWMTRYYSMGHTYQTHPYEVEAIKFERNYQQIV
jgi:hypothetical protein